MSFIGGSFYLKKPIVSTQTSKHFSKRYYFLANVNRIK